MQKLGMRRCKLGTGESVFSKCFVLFGNEPSRNRRTSVLARWLCSDITILKAQPRLALSECMWAGMVRSNLYDAPSSYAFKDMLQN